MKGAVRQDSAVQNAASVAAQFVRARRSACALDGYPGLVPENLADAYRCQDQAIELWPDEIAGWKVARVPKEWAEKFPDARINGPAFSRNIHKAGRESDPSCPVFAGGFGAVETEIVIRVGADAPPNKYEWTIAEAVDFIADMHLGVEIASSPLATLNDLGTGAVISDFGNNWGIVVGNTIPGWREIASIACETFIDERSVGARTVSIEQGPLTAFAFTLGKCASRGYPLRAGAWITTGMITGVHDINIGQRSLHVFAGYGQIGCRIVRAEPFE